MPTRILVTLTILWTVITIPLCFCVYLYLAHQLKAQTEERQINQEHLLTETFAQSARFGDIVDNKTNVESLGKSFGLSRVMICHDGIDIIGGMVKEPCPTEYRHYDLRIIDQDLQLYFIWSANSAIATPIVLRAILITFMLSLAIFVLIAWVTYRFLTGKIGSLSRRIAGSEGPLLDFDVELPELEPIANAISVMQLKIVKSNEEIANLRTAEALGKMSRQVAHDIRSPLSALKIFSAKAQASPDLLGLMSSAIERIEGIARDLLNFKPESADSENTIAPKFFSDLISIKNTEGRGEPIQLKMDHLQNPKITMGANVLFRILSNLINNSIEAAVPGRPLQLVVHVIQGSDDLLISITDNGKGIPKDVRERLGKGAVSVGKDHGFGLGLSYGFSEVQKAGGQLSIDNAVPVGTKITISLPTI